MNVQVPAPRSKIALVLTRDVVAGSGRTGTLAKILEGLARENAVDTLRLRNVLETRRPGDLVMAGMTWLAGLMRGRPMPLQCLLYASRRETARLVAQIRDGGYSAIMLDTVRCQFLLRQLRRALPGAFIVTDFDDLLSRRMQFLADHKLALLTGHTAASFPAWLRRLAEGPLARLVTAYEAMSLRHAEKEAAALSDAVVLVSAKECALLRAQIPAEARIHLIPPYAQLQAPPWAAADALRFVFIGSDRLLQNRLAIEHLLKLWRTLKPATPLHIYSPQTRPTPQIAGVHWHGFAAGLGEVYQPGSILLLPSLVAGGIKTKVAEAWSYGCPVLGNDAAFEGFAINDYPLALPLADWAPLLTTPEAHSALWVEAACKGQAFVARALTAEQFHRAWADAMTPQDQVMVSSRAAEMLETVSPRK